MKVGLLTFHSAHNYGAVLQAFATQEIVKSLDFEINVIDYSPNYLSKQRILPRFESHSISINFKLLIEGVVCLIWRYIRRKGFEEFIHSKFILSEESYGKWPLTHNENYDAYIMGSDQIWNIQKTHGFDSAYWGDFITKENAIKISYAASMSYYDLDDTQISRMSGLLKNFNSISVREEEAKQFLYQNFQSDSTVVLDPVFLLDKSKWSLISKKPKTRKKYILVYTLLVRDDVMRIANELAKQLDVSVIELTGGINKNVLINRHQTATPEEFLGLFENSEYVITSSFHGTAFSIIFNKLFYTIGLDNDKDTRPKSILTKLGLMDRFISRQATPDFKIFNYDDANTRLEKLRNESIAFLRNNLLNY